MNQGQLKTKPFCPHCNAMLDGWTATTDKATPTTDDLTICAYCAEVLQYDENMLLVEITGAVLDDMSSEVLTSITRAKKVVQQIIKKRGACTACPSCHKVSYSAGDIKNQYCRDCGYYSEQKPPFNLGYKT